MPCRICGPGPGPDPGPYGAPRGAGADDIRAGCCAVGEAGACCCCWGRVWLTTLILWRSAYMVSMRGTCIPASCASLMGDPRYVSTSIGLREVKSWYITLCASVGAIICSIVSSRKPLRKLQPWTLASAMSSSMTPVISGRTPTFSSSSACDGSSKMTLAG